MSSPPPAVAAEATAAAAAPAQPSNISAAAAAASSAAFRGPPMRRCAGCRSAAANPYRDLCQGCYEAWMADGARICAACRAIAPNPGHDLCSSCYARWRVASLGAGITADTFRVATTEGGDDGDSAEAQQQLRDAREEDLWAPADVAADSEEEDDDCAICLLSLREEPPVVRLAACTHRFHRACIAKCVHGGSLTCPICSACVGVRTGQQPPGVMAVLEQPFPLPGYEAHGTLTILYEMPSGIQGPQHPHPGMPYRGTQRVAFLPASDEGRKVLNLLKIAFSRHLIFGVGVSATTGRDDVVVWASIHHKTNVSGGPPRHGYPDDTYLARVQEELAAVGVK